MCLLILLILNIIIYLINVNALRSSELFIINNSNYNKIFDKANSKKYKALKARKMI